mmetsp:Transcript_13256/g.26933  ORF Transcript_13256/g.26933 Transcript_13256/m.26933 type:complete len:192 (+) Transcript_13256:338-913(+)
MGVVVRSLSSVGGGNAPCIIGLQVCLSPYHLSIVALRAKFSRERFCTPSPSGLVVEAALLFSTLVLAGTGHVIFWLYSHNLDDSLRSWVKRGVLVIMNLALTYTLLCLLQRFFQRFWRENVLVLESRPIFGEELDNDVAVVDIAQDSDFATGLTSASEYARWGRGAWNYFLLAAGLFTTGGFEIFLLTKCR